MKLIYFIASLAIICTMSLAQTSDSTKTRKPKSVTFNPNSQRNGYESYQGADAISGVGMAPGAIINTVDLRYEGLRGNPYFLSEWCKGKFETITGQIYPDVIIKFDAFRQQLVLLRTWANGGTWANGDSTILSADQVKSFELVNENGQTYRFRKLSTTVKTKENALKEGYFMVIYEGTTSLLKRVEKKFKPADYKVPYSIDVRYDEFKKYDSYFLLKPDQTLTKVKLSK